MQKSVHVQRQGSAACCPVPEIQEDTATRQGTTQWLRSVRPEQAVIRPSSQMAVVPDTFQQTTARREVATGSARMSMETANIKQPGIPETRKAADAAKEAPFRASVAAMVRSLREEEQEKVNGTFDIVSYCLTVVRAYRKLSQKEKTLFLDSKVHHIRNQDFLTHTMAPIYDAALNDALKKLQQDLAKNGNPREYFKKIDRVATQAGTLLRNFPGYQGYMKTLGDLFRHCINIELLYLKYLSLKTSPSLHAVQASVDAINWLLSSDATAYYLALINDQERQEIQTRKNKLLNDIHSRMNSRTAEEEKEKSDVLKDDMFHGFADALAEMELFDKLKEKLGKLKEQYGYVPEDIQQCTCLLKEITELCDYYDQSGIETFVLHHEIQRFLAAAIRKILLSPETCAGEPLLNETLELIAHLTKSKNNWVNAECQELYKSYSQTEKSLMGATARTDKETERYCQELMSEISKCVKTDNDTDHLHAAELLLQLLRDYNGGAGMRTQASLQKRASVAKNRLRYKLFTVVINEYNNYRQSKKDKSEISSLMSYHKPRFLELIPYMYILDSDDNANLNTLWKHIACHVWHNDVERLRHAETFSKKDVDVLLCMKRLAPTTRNYHEVYSNVIDAMKNFFRFTLRDQAATAFIEETVELSAWVDCLCHFYRIEELKALNEAWKQKYQGAASAKSMASSNALAEVMPAATAYPAIVDASMEAPGCHLHMERQPAPDMKPVTELVDTPVPAAWRSPWQSVSVACCTPMTPPSAANSLQSTPAKHFSLDHHEMLTGDQRHFPVHPHVQGFSAACGSVQSQSYMASQPQHPSQPMTSAECEAGYSQASRGIIEQVERQINALHMMRYNLSHVPIQGGEHQQQLPLVWCPDVNASHLDNDDAITGILHLLTAVKSYLQQKASELRVSILETPPSVEPWSKCQSVFKEGVDRLIEGMQQIIGSAMNRDAVYKLLMQLGNQKSKSKIDELFTGLKTNLKGKKSVEEDRAVLQKLDIIHKLLLSVDILIKSR